MIRVWLLLWLIASLICKLNAAALKDSKTIDLNQTTVSDDEQTATTYHGQEHLTMNDSKVIIDLYTPTSRPTNDSTSNDGNADDSVVKKTTPLVQLVINKPNVIETVDNTTASTSTTSITSTTTDKTTTTPTTTTKNPTTQRPITTNAHTPLIPPASVNASIKQLDKGSKSKQGQIIIRYAYFWLSHSFHIQMHFNSSLFCA